MRWGCWRNCTVLSGADLVFACRHPLEVKSEADILSVSGVRLLSGRFSAWRWRAARIIGWVAPVIQKYTTAQPMHGGRWKGLPIAALADSHFFGSIPNRILLGSGHGGRAAPGAISGRVVVHWSLNKRSGRALICAKAPWDSASGLDARGEATVLSQMHWPNLPRPV